jgi:hypothetical protein
VFSLKRACAAVVAALLCAGALAQPVFAHQGNPNFRSIVHGITPSAHGLRVQVLGGDDRLELDNRSGKTVVVLGYDGEPYARLLPDGTVQVNNRSPSKYLNQDRFGATNPPAFATEKAPPQWVVDSKTSKFFWHDHRIHWMAKTVPPQVKDKHKKTKIFDYEVPLEIDGKPAAIEGTLIWVGPSGASIPTAAIFAFVALLIVLVPLAIRTQRRRMGITDEPEATEERDKAVTEAW